MNVQEFLSNRNIPFDTLAHDPTYTAQRLAQAVHVSGEEVAKTVLLAVDDGFILAVLPATRHVDLMRLQEFLGAGRVDIADETDCGRRFGDCELGALPPFGSTYGMRTIVDNSLLADETIVFEGNSHQEAIRMRREDYIAVEDPIMADFTHYLQRRGRHGRLNASARAHK